MGTTSHKYESEFVGRKRWVILVSVSILFTITQNQTGWFPKDGQRVSILDGLVNVAAIN